MEEELKKEETEVKDKELDKEGCTWGAIKLICGIGLILLGIGGLLQTC
jgi:hypothetical protein